MPLLCPIENLKDNSEIVLCDSALSKQAHMDLFHYNEDVYITVKDSEDYFLTIADAVNICNSDIGACISRMHVVVNWLNLLKVSFWQAERLSINNVILLLKNIGIGNHELQPFKKSDINDIFPWLYYGKRFDVMRKICHTAKRQIEGRFKEHFTKVDCHLIAEDAKRIVASSL